MLLKQLILSVSLSFALIFTSAFEQSAQAEPVSPAPSLDGQVFAKKSKRKAKSKSKRKSKRKAAQIASAAIDAQAQVEAAGSGRGEGQHRRKHRRKGTGSGSGSGSSGSGAGSRWRSFVAVLCGNPLWRPFVNTFKSVNVNTVTSVCPARC